MSEAIDRKKWMVPLSVNQSRYALLMNPIQCGEQKQNRKSYLKQALIESNDSTFATDGDGGRKRNHSIPYCGQPES